MSWVLVAALWGGSFVSQTAAPSDGLCQPCNIATDCPTGICGSTGYCLQSCATNSACPTNFSCQSEVCAPNDPNSSCKGVWTGIAPGNQCYIDPQDANGGISSLACENGYNCFNFGSLGYCLPACNASQSCSDSAATCCYGVAGSSECSTDPSANPNGGCITVGHVGSSCALPSAALCDNQTDCFYVSQPAQAACYHTCTSGTCPSSAETCVQLADANGDDYNICCQTSSYTPADPTSCVPNPPPCLRNTLVACETNADCQSGLCLNYKGQSACSMSCTSSSDCPSASQDVNGDGKADGGGSCVTVNGSGSCWPNDGPVTAPTCADAGKGGCSCNSISPDSVAALLGLGLASLAARRRLARHR